MLSLLAITAIAIAVTRDLFAAVMFAGIYGLVSACFFVLMDAVDVAFTEAAVGAGIAPLLMLITLVMTGRYQSPSKNKVSASTVIVLVVGALLIFTTTDLPDFGSADAPVQTHVSPRYLQDSASEIGIPNVVTSVLASYRAFDTLGEVAVIFTAGIAVLSILALRQKPSNDSPASLHEHRVLRVVGKIFIPPILIFALYVQFHGEYGPGGGFQAGVIFAAGLILYSMIFGVSSFPRRVINHSGIRICAAFGLLLYSLVGVLGMLTGENFLGYNKLAADPITGQHLGIILIELGVGITVTAVMLLVYFAFADYKRMSGE